MEEVSVKKWNGRNHHIETYKWLNGVEIRDNKETLLVNCLYLETKNVETDKVIYKNSWVTNKTITKDNCVSSAYMPQCHSGERGGRCGMHAEKRA
jgi:hypothetical protein